MNSHPKSIGKLFLTVRFGAICFILLTAWLSACSSSGTVGGSSEGNRVKIAAPPDDEVSLRADRSALDELRKDEPAGVKKQNDESALIMGLMSDTKIEPGTVREKWSDMVRKKRESFDKWSRANRENFNKDETKNRDTMLAQLAKEREKFSSSKHASDERSKFFDDSDEKRREFFAQQRERREDFDSIMREKRQTFDGDIRERQSQFEQAYRDFSVRYREDGAERDRQKKAQEFERERQLEQRAQGRAKEAATESAVAGPSLSGGSTSLSLADRAQREKDLRDFQKMPTGHQIPLSTSGVEGN